MTTSRAILCLAFIMSACGERNVAAPPDLSPNRIDLDSDAADYIGGGRDYSYSNANAVIAVGAEGARLSIGIHGDEWWNATFQLPAAFARLEKGTFAGLERFPFHDADKGGLSWSGDGRGCNTLSGSFTISYVEYDQDSTLTAVDLSFEQHCDGATPALRGTIHWRADDPTVPPGPVTPIPANLWRPGTGATPATGNYVFLQSDAGDYIGRGLTATYTNFTVGSDAAAVGVNVENSRWGGNFSGMNTLSRLEVGYYPDLMRDAFHNPTKGGLDWHGEGRGCNTLTGWFAVDLITYTNGNVSALDLRFEQHCDGVVPALRGEIHWRAP